MKKQASGQLSPIRIDKIELATVILGGFKRI